MNLNQRYGPKIPFYFENYIFLFRAGSENLWCWNKPAEEANKTKRRAPREEGEEEEEEDEEEESGGSSNSTSGGGINLNKYGGCATCTKNTGYWSSKVPTCTYGAGSRVEVDLACLLVMMICTVILLHSNECI